jgi:hypothetical protein
MSQKDSVLTAVGPIQNATALPDVPDTWVNTCNNYTAVQTSAMAARLSMGPGNDR